MMFIYSVANLVAAFLDISFLRIWFFPMIALCFVASIPSIIRVLTTWR